VFSSFLNTVCSYWISALTFRFRRCNRKGWYFLHTLLVYNTNWALFKHHSHIQCCFWSCPSFYDHSRPSSDLSSWQYRAKTSEESVHQFA